MGTSLILIIIIIGVVAFAIISTIMSKKNQKLEKNKRKQQVKEEIKRYLKETYNTKNVRVDFSKVVARKGKELKYRDIFDVIVEVFDSKKNKLLEIRALEIEGYSHKISKKEYRTDWKVNGELDLEETKYQIALSQGKIKLTKDELKKQKQESQEKNKKLKLEDSTKNMKTKEEKKIKKLAIKNMEASDVKIETKFAPRK